MIILRKKQTKALGVNNLKAGSRTRTGDGVYFSVTEKYQKAIGGTGTRNADLFGMSEVFDCTEAPMRLFSPGRHSVPVSKLPERSAMWVLPGCAGIAALRAAGAYGELNDERRYSIVHSCNRQIRFLKHPYTYEHGRSVDWVFTPAVILSVRKFDFRHFRYHTEL